jgi:putative transposase
MLTRLRLQPLRSNVSKPPRDRTSFGSNVYFVTAGTWGHRSLFQTERMAGLFIDTIYHYRRERKFLLHEFVVMPTHFHLLLTPSEIKLERALQFIKGGFSFRVKNQLALNMEIWERGYVDHRIRDATDYAVHVGYIRQNPVEGKIVSRAEDYLYSSAHGGFELDSCPRELTRVYAVAR